MFVYGLPISKKVEFLVKSQKTRDLSERAVEHINEIKLIVNMWSNERNLIAHGFSVSTLDGELELHTVKSQKGKQLDELDSFLEHARYVCNQALQLNVCLASPKATRLFPIQDRPT